ncbi:MAG: glycerol-3-phosphate dehydrogenase/oxidase [Pseudobacteriovorax sp.]|nr:glycerol-3-phosphate dehydrogenase/oxidase [Pseudobacteriovorax sp.]
MTLRTSNILDLQNGVLDVLVIGGGINGAVSATALAGKGSRVGLVEKSDYASYTSQESSNLAWGGIKYLESYEFSLVWGLCQSRNRLMRSFPSQVKEIRFFAILPKGFRKPSFLIYAGTWLYWFMGRGFTKTPRFLSKRRIKKEQPVIASNNCQGGVEYSDSYLTDNDARFVFKFVRKAMDYGCHAVNYAEVIDCNYSKGIWDVTILDHLTTKTFTIQSRSVVNACGPFADKLNQNVGIKTSFKHVFSKGVHLIVPQITDSRKVLTFFASDGRMFFVIPMGPRSCIGTTDSPVKQLPAIVTDEDRDFILENINQLLQLKTALTRDDIIAERCGVRPLVVKGDRENTNADWLSLSRKHEIEGDRQRRFVTIYGGKLTDCINVGEEVAGLLASMNIHIPNPKSEWFGEPSEAVRLEFQKQAHAIQLDNLTAPTSCEPLSVRLWRRYGFRALELVEDIRCDPSMADLVIEGAEYIRAELHYAAKSEMVVDLSDFLRRRSKIALVATRDTIRTAPGLKEACEILFGPEAQSKLDDYFSNH